MATQDHRTLHDRDDGWQQDHEDRIPPVLLSAHAQAAEIERLAAEVEQLEIALKTIRVVVGAVTAGEGVTP